MNKRSEPIKPPYELHPKTPKDESPASSTNLVLIYSLIALALLTAIGFAVLIVLPFYHRR